MNKDTTNILALFGCFCAIIVLIEAPIFITKYSNAIISIEKEKNRGQYERLTYNNMLNEERRISSKKNYETCLRDADTELSQGICLRAYEIEMK